MKVRDDMWYFYVKQPHLHPSSCETRKCKMQMKLKFGPGFKFIYSLLHEQTYVSLFIQQNSSTPNPTLPLYEVIWIDFTKGFVLFYESFGFCLINFSLRFSKINFFKSTFYLQLTLIICYNNVHQNSEFLFLFTYFV